MKETIKTGGRATGKTHALANSLERKDVAVSVKSEAFLERARILLKQHGEAFDDGVSDVVKTSAIRGNCAVLVYSVIDCNWWVGRDYTCERPHSIKLNELETLLKHWNA